MGYVRELSGIARRAARAEGAWRPHLEATKSHIERAARSCPGDRAALVLGSGMLLDIPIAALSARFARVVLADIHHPRPVRRATRRHKNVELVQADVTGVARPVFDYVRRRRTGPLPKGDPAGLFAGDFDLVASVNLLSQLAVIPRQYLASARPSMPPYMMDEFGRHIVQAHIAWLGRFAGRVVLVTDYERVETGPGGKAVRKNILEGVTLPPPEASWTWDIAPLGSVYRDLAVTHEVAAYTDFTPCR